MRQPRTAESGYRSLIFLGYSLDVRVERECLFVLRRKAWAVFVSRSAFVSRTARRPGRSSARFRRGGRGDSLCDGAAETRRRAARRAAPRRTRFREENHGKDASATAAGGSERPIPASVKKVSGCFPDARKYFLPSVYRGLVKIWDNLSQEIWDKPVKNTPLPKMGK